MLVEMVHEIRARMGRAKALYILGCGPECRDTPWDGLYPFDPDLDDELEKAGIHNRQVTARSLPACTTSELTSEQQLAQVAAIFARGVVRYGHSRRHNEIPSPASIHEILAKQP